MTALESDYANRLDCLINFCLSELRVAERHTETERERERERERESERERGLASVSK